MLIPYNTDAPVYHFPAATLGLIVANVLAFAITGAGDVQGHSGWILHYGSVNPIEWLSSLFFHMGPLHLLGNMLFLWVFGLVVEGKIGWQRFLILYFTIGIAQNIVEQLIMLVPASTPLGSAGASGAIFGLLAVAMVWAPKNDIRCFLFLAIRGLFIDISILFMAVAYIVIELLLAAYKEFAMSSQIIHLLGGVLGLGIGAWMVKHGRVDCEKWDLFSVMKGANNAALPLQDYQHVGTEEAMRRLSESGSFNFTPKAQEAAAQIVDLIDSEKYRSAANELRRHQHLVTDYQLEQQPLRQLVRGLYRLKEWDAVTPLIAEFIERFPGDSAGMHIRHAAILLEVHKRPKAASRAAELVDVDRLNDRQRRELQKIKRAARKLVESGHLELGSD